MLWCFLSLLEWNTFCPMELGSKKFTKIWRMGREEVGDWEREFEGAPFMVQVFACASKTLLSWKMSTKTSQHKTQEKACMLAKNAWKFKL